MRALYNPFEMLTLAGDIMTYIQDCCVRYCGLSDRATNDIRDSSSNCWPGASDQQSVQQAESQRQRTQENRQRMADVKWQMQDTCLWRAAGTAAVQKKVKIPKECWAVLCRACNSCTLYMLADPICR